jgi:hypothetical protein
MFILFLLLIAILSIGRVRSHNLIADDRYWFIIKILVISAILFSLLEYVIYFLLVV